jgi:hypothetical protein
MIFTPNELQREQIRIKKIDSEIIRRKKNNYTVVEILKLYIYYKKSYTRPNGSNRCTASGTSCQIKNEL